MGPANNLLTVRLLNPHPSFHRQLAFATKTKERFQGTRTYLGVAARAQGTDQHAHEGPEGAFLALPISKSTDETASFITSNFSSEQMELYAHTSGRKGCREKLALSCQWNAITLKCRMATRVQLHPMAVGSDSVGYLGGELSSRINQVSMLFRLRFSVDSDETCATVVQKGVLPSWGPILRPEKMSLGDPCRSLLDWHLAISSRLD